jgi:uncharacterized protein (TIGR02996 family)
MVLSDFAERHPMSDLHALIRACKDEPEDDAPRLVLADWLDEHEKTEHAQFIRLTVGKGNRRWSSAAKELLDSLLLQWLGVFGVEVTAGRDPGAKPGLFYVRQVRRVRCALRQPDVFARTIEFALTFERGFATRLSVGLHDSRLIAPSLLRANPMIRVEVNDLRLYVPDLGSQAPLKIDVGMAWIGDEPFSVLAGYDEFRPVDPPFHYVNTNIKRFRIRRGELADMFRRRVSTAINEAITVAANWSVFDSSESAADTLSQE